MTDRILLIYEMIPENTVVYLIPCNVFTEDERSRLRLCHNHFINLAGNMSDHEAAMAWLSEWLVGADKHKIYDNRSGDKNITLPWHTMPGAYAPVVEIIVTGFMF